MAKVRLPDIAGLPVVCFHYNPHKNPSRVVLQVPTEGYEDSNTYNINLDSADDTKWLITRKNGLRLLDKIKLYGAVAYTAAGECIVLEIDDGKTATSRYHNLVAAAHRERDKIARREAARNYKMPAMRRRKPKQPYLPS